MSKSAGRLEDEWRDVGRLDAVDLVVADLSCSTANATR